MKSLSERQHLAPLPANGESVSHPVPQVHHPYNESVLPIPSGQEKPGQKGSAGYLKCVEAMHCPSQAQQRLPLATDVGICQTNPNHLMRNENGVWFLHLIAPLKTTHRRFIVITIIAS